LKNQYFGDTRDLFKYDLSLTVCRELQLGFSFIPMLTAPDGRTHGNQTDYSHAKAGFNNGLLCSFLKDCIEGDKRDVHQLSKYVATTGIEYRLYDFQGQFLTKQNRNAYFKGIGGEFLSNSLILLDPDNGLQVQKSVEKHLLYPEVKSLFDKMDGGAVLMVIQFFPYVNHSEYIRIRQNGLQQLLKCRISWVTDNQIIFFFIPRSEQQNGRLHKTMREYCQAYERLTWGT
jgi:hypothetical protein